jgi:hypothetical protein
LQKHVDRLEPIQEGVLVRDGRIVRRYFYRVAHGYRYAAADTREGRPSRE